MEQHSSPVIAVIGLDPQDHVIPPLLLHHLTKMSKDFRIVFIDGPALSDKTGEALKVLLEKSGYIPVMKAAVTPVAQASTLLDAHGRSL